MTIDKLIELRNSIKDLPLDEDSKSYLQFLVEHELKILSEKKYWKYKDNLKSKGILE